MSEVHYRVVEHDGGWAYVSQGVYSETFPTHDAAAQAARRAAAEQTLSGNDETIEYEDEAGRWHVERRRATTAPSPTSRIDTRRMSAQATGTPPLATIG